jgi:transmembrane sensor
MFGAVKLLPDREPINPLGAAEFVTGARETATVTLTDGTIVRLAPGSRLRLPTGGVTRDVWLDGQAYFAVKSDSARPFIVRTQAGDATVLGTRFELRTREDELRLVVVEGRVALEAGGEKVEVGADEVSHVKDGAGPSLARVDNVHELLEWTEGLLIFQSTPITQVSRELARHFGVSIEIQDSRIADRKVTGWFTDETLDEVLIAICRASGIDCTLEGDTVRIRAPGQ